MPQVIKVVKEAISDGLWPQWSKLLNIRDNMTLKELIYSSQQEIWTTDANDTKIMASDFVCTALLAS